MVCVTVAPSPPAFATASTKATASAATPTPRAYASASAARLSSACACAALSKCASSKPSSVTDTVAVCVSPSGCASEAGHDTDPRIMTSVAANPPISWPLRRKRYSPACTALRSAIVAASSSLSCSTVNGSPRGVPAGHACGSSVANVRAPSSRGHMCTCASATAPSLQPPMGSSGDTSMPKETTHSPLPPSMALPSRHARHVTPSASHAAQPSSAHAAGRYEYQPPLMPPVGPVSVNGFIATSLPSVVRENDTRLPAAAPDDPLFLYAISRSPA
mmetsp:Transcript_15878/g.55284  ORF Transcript_15878/g.55284 Transcript_15878/m.55284 type:complete len:275 (+) Transcript_15878:319-1143(+)